MKQKYIALEIKINVYRDKGYESKAVAEKLKNLDGNIHKQRSTKNHGMDKQTKSGIEQMSSSPRKIKRI